MGAYLIIMPDKKYINTKNYSDCGNIEATTALNSFTITPCLLDGTSLFGKSQPTPPDPPQNLDYWIDTSGETPVLKQYSADKGQWISVATTYIRIHIEDAEYLANRSKNELNICDVKINYVGAVIGSHSGPGTLALFFLGTER